MDLSNTSNQQRVADPAYRKLHRVFFAVCLLLAPLALSLWFSLCPQYGNPQCPTSNDPLSVLVAYRAANPLLIQVFLFINMIVPYVYPPSYIGLGLLAMKRAPWLATLGIVCGFAGSIVWSLVASNSALTNSMAHFGQDRLFTMVWTEYGKNWEIAAMGIGWGIGHQLAYVLLGIALLRARVGPRWAAWLIVVSAPVMGPIAYGTGLGLLQVLGYVLVFIGSVPAALVMLRGPGLLEP